MRRSLTLALAGLMAATMSLPAQSAQQWSVQGSGLMATLSGAAYFGTNYGSDRGGEAQLRYTTRVGWSFGAGYQKTTNIAHTLSGPFFEPRYSFVLGDNERIFPYLSGRFSYLNLQQSTFNYSCASTCDSTSYASGQNSTSGSTIGAGGGLLLRLTSRVNMDVGATYGWNHFGDITATVNQNNCTYDTNGTPTCTYLGQVTSKTPAGSGSNLVGRLGLAIGLF